MNTQARSYLFVPGNRPERFAKAQTSGTDAVILDLEDAVLPDAKSAARAAVAAALDTLAVAPPLYVRINGAQTPWFADDVTALAGHPRVAGIVLPKAESARQIEALLSTAHAALSMLPIIETAQGYAHLAQICAAPRVTRIVFGTLDFQLDLGIEADETGEKLLSELLPFRAGIVLASRVAGLAAPVDGVTTTIDDAAAIEAAARQSRRAGFGAKLCIHPKQIDPVHRAWAWSAAERDWAKRVLTAIAQSSGAVTVDGRMVDAPVVERARRIVGNVHEGGHEV